MVDPEMGKGQMLDGELCVMALPKRHETRTTTNLRTEVGSTEQMTYHVPSIIHAV